MKKENICNFLYFISALLILGFAITFGVDAYKYNTGGYIGSAPLDLYLLVRAIEFIVPSIIVFVAAIICKKKFAGKAKDASKQEESMSKAKRIAEWIFIGLFIAIVALIASIQIYRAVVNSDWYTEKQARKGFEQIVEKVNDRESIKSIQVDDNIEVRVIYDAPAELFDDLSIERYEHIDDVEKIVEILKQNCVTVFFNDGTSASFFITDSGELYWGTDLKIESNSLLEWYNSIVNN